MLTTEIISLFREAQHFFNDTMLAHLEALKQGHALLAYASLALVGFLYGIVHAIGPGHGKVVVSSYILANENSLKRGLLVVALSSLLQATTAIAIVLGFSYVLQATRAEAEHVAALLEIGSYALIAALGIWFFGRGLVLLGHTLCYGHDEEHHHDHDEGCCCHEHMPSACCLTDEKTSASLAAMILCIGIRPCTGALILLFFSCMFDLPWPGVLATLTMAMGTAITTGTLAILAVKSKEVALMFVEESERGLRLAHAGLRLGGGLVIFLMASLFLAAQFGGENISAAAPPPLYKALK
jgi:ABC-type nickel/cobalt efflux system permease component RcnA